MNREEANKWVEINELRKDSLIEEKFDNAIVGHSHDDKVIYDVDKMIDILIDEGKTAIEAIEYLDVAGYFNSQTAIFMSAYNKEYIETHEWLKSLSVRNILNK